MAALTCTPADTLRGNPCLACMSIHELMAVAVVLGAKALETYDEPHYVLPEDTDKLLKDSACFTCLSDKQLLQSFLAIQAVDLMGETTPNIRQSARCLDCANPKQLKAAFVYLWCLLFQAVAPQPI